MALEDVLTRAVGPFSSHPTNPVLIRSWQRSALAGVARNETPVLRRVQPEELSQRQAANRGLLEAAIPHLAWLSRWFHQRPHVAYLVDRDGIVLHAEGDADAITRYGLSPGTDWSEHQMGTNGAGTALAAGVPVAVIGCDHWSAWWKDATCLGAPILAADGTATAAIDISMDVREGDEERLAVAAHVAYTISQELGRREAEAALRAKDDAYAAARSALEAEHRARAAAEAALVRERQTEAALRESEARLSLALEKAGMGTWEMDVASGACEWSEQIAALFGLPRDEKAGSLARVLELIHEEDRGALLRAARSAADGASVDIEVRTRWPDGSIHWIQARGHSAPGRDGTAIRLIGIGQDVTSRKEADAALRRSEHLLRTIIDSTGALVYIVDDRNRFRLINRQFAQLFGLSVDEATGRSLYDYFPAEVADQLAANNRKALQTGESCEFEEIVSQPDGPHAYVSVKAPIYDVDGVPYAICGVSTDITERNRLVAALEATQRQKDAAIAALAHELRQPLGAIQAALAVMRARVSRDKGERARTILERQLAQLSRLVEDLLDAARIARGTVTLRREHTSLNDIVSAAVNVVQPIVAERGQHLQVDVPGEPVWLHADGQRLQQVFSNLLTNASKFTAPDGRITLTVECSDECAVVRVRDTGRGLAPDVMPHIFDLFVQATPDEGGLGIGLAVVRALVERHGGSVEARSPGPGQGSEFIVRLPTVVSV